MVTVQGGLFALTERAQFIRINGGKVKLKKLFGVESIPLIIPV